MPEQVGRLMPRLARNKTVALALLDLAAPVGARASMGVSAATMTLLLILAAAIAVVLPRYTRSCLAIEDRINLRTGSLGPGRSSRLIFVLPPSLAAALLASSPPFIFALGLVAAAGAQASAARLAYRGTGDRSTNAIVAYACPFWLMSLADLPFGVPIAASVLVVFAAVFFVDLGRGIWTDRRGLVPRKGGIGIFFGTFNPIHRTHIAIMRAALADRCLERIYLHCTSVPKLHRDALAAGEIAFDYRDGMRIYRKTDKADPNKIYFPTGVMFFDYGVRHALLKAAVRDTGLENEICVLDLPDLYEREGFFGLARHIRALNPDAFCHGLHGSDPGGMWVRNIFEACGGIQPYAVRRRDAVSATAIRNGGIGMTTPTVERFLGAVREGRSFVFEDGYAFVAPTPAASPGSDGSAIRGETEVGRGCAS